MLITHGDHIGATSGPKTGKHHPNHHHTRARSHPLLSVVEVPHLSRQLLPNTIPFWDLPRGLQGLSPKAYNLLTTFRGVSPQGDPKACLMSSFRGFSPQGDPKSYPMSCNRLLEPCPHRHTMSRAPTHAYTHRDLPSGVPHKTCDNNYAHAILILQITNIMHIEQS